MAKIALVTFYNDFSVGMNVLNSRLIIDGHDVVNIYFKLPIKKVIGSFSTEKVNYMEAVNAYGDIVGGNDMINRWTDVEIELLIKLLKDLSPDIIGFSSRSTDNDLATYLFPKIRQRVKAVTIAGGVGPSLNPEKYTGLVDYVYVGEAETTIQDLISILERGEDLSSFPGIHYKRGEAFVANRLANPNKSLFKKQILNKQSYYIENDHLYDYDNRQDLISTHTYSTFYGKGCINKCSYCSIGNWHAIYSKAGYKVKPRRNRQVEDIIEELKELDTSGITFIHFRDEYLTARSTDLIRFFKMYEKEIGLPFWAYLVPQQVIECPEILKSAVDAGFVDTEIGFQSGSDYINRTVFNRNVPHKQTVAYTHMIDQYQINRKYDFIIGNPIEKEVHIKEAFKLIQSLPKDRAYLFLPKLFYFPNTPLSKLLKKYSIFTEAENEKYYKIGLLYLICFVTQTSEFEKVLADDKLNSSSARLLDFYRELIREKNIEFPIGTHDVPGSITTHRYERILKNNRYQKIIIWKDNAYYDEMSHIFDGLEKIEISDEPGTDPDHELIFDAGNTVPVFICTGKKQQIKKHIWDQYPAFQGRVYV